MKQSTVDRSVPCIRVIMVKQDLTVYPAFSLPKGFSFIDYNESLKGDWIRIQTAAGNASDVGAAEEILDEKLKAECLETGERDFQGQLEKRMIFAGDLSGRIAGTACLWYGSHFGRKQNKLHWVAVDPEYQGLGLAKAMITKLLDMNREMRLTLYLVTTTQSWRAVALYGTFGFEPYTGGMPPGWRPDGIDAPEYDGLSFEDKNAMAWTTIGERLRDAEYK